MHGYKEGSEIWGETRWIIKPQKAGAQTALDLLTVGVPKETTAGSVDIQLTQQQASPAPWTLS